MRERTRTDYIAIHCSATKPTKDIGEDEIRAMHTARGWSDIGYNAVIRRDGRIEIGRPLDYAGAHIKEFNLLALGVCLVGGVGLNGKPENNFTPEQFESLEDLLRLLDRVYPGTIIRGHRDFFGDTNNDGVIDSRDWLKDCPCFDVQAWVKERGIRS